MHTNLNLQKLFNQTAIYGLSSILGRVLNYLLVPIYTQLLHPADYAVVTELYAYMAFLNIIYSYGMETSFFRFASKACANIIFNVSFSLLLISSLCFSLLILITSNALKNILGYTEVTHFHYLYYMVAILALDAILVIPFAKLRLTNQSFFFAKAKILQVIVNLLFNILFLYILPRYFTNVNYRSNNFITAFMHQYVIKDYVVAILLANLIANFSVVPFLRNIFKCYHFQLSWKLIKPMLRYAFPLLIVGLAGTTNEMLSRALLKYLLPSHFYEGMDNATALGSFGACYKLAIFMSLGVQAFRYAAEPFFFSKIKDKDAPLLFSQVMQGYVIFACFIWFAISANLNVLGYLFLRNSTYRIAIEIVPYLTLAYLLTGIYYHLSMAFKLADKTYYATFITILGAMVTIVLNVWLVPLWGYFGSVYATLGSITLMVILGYYLGQKCYKVNYPVSKIGSYIGITYCLIWCIRHVNYTNWFYGLICNICYTGVFGLACIFFIRKTKAIKIG